MQGEKQKNFQVVDGFFAHFFLKTERNTAVGGGETPSSLSGVRQLVECHVRGSLLGPGECGCYAGVYQLFLNQLQGPWEHCTPCACVCVGASLRGRETEIHKHAESCIS